MTMSHTSLNRNNVGPRTEPCGTPLVTRMKLDSMLSGFCYAEKLQSSDTDLQINHKLQLILAVVIARRHFLKSNAVCRQIVSIAY